MLKSIYKFLLLSLCLLLSLPAYAEEYIEHFNSDITVNPNGSLTIVETITVYHEGNYIKRGIYRKFSTAKHERYKILSVTRNNNPEPWFTEQEGDYLRLNTGNDDFLPEFTTSTYTIIYEMYDVLRPIKDTDLNEIYLNITGQWSIPIHTVTTQVYYPEGTNITSRYAYVQDETINYTPLPNHAYVFSDLPAGTQLTIAESFSKGTVNIELPLFFKYLIISFILMFVYYLIAWMIWGIDPSPRAIMPDWEPPAGLSPLECAYITNNGKAPKNSFFIHILWLISQKAASIREVQKGQFAKTKGFEINPLPTADKLNYETKLFTSRYSKGMTVYASEPDEDLAQYNQKLNKGISEHLEKIAYRKRNIQTIIGAIFVPLTLFFIFNPDDVASAIFATAMLLSFLLNGGVIGIVSVFIFITPIIIALLNSDPAILVLFILYIATVLTFKYLMFQPTVYGQRLKEKIEGIKMFLTTVTKNHIALKEHLPNKNTYDMSMRGRLTPEDMEALFPYAVALGLEKEWEHKFKSIFDTKQWITMTDRNFYYQNHCLHDFNRCYLSSMKATHFSQTAASAGRFSSGGGSFGGGFSGGGFGGGGGGGR